MIALPSARGDVFAKVREDMNRGQRVQCKKGDLRIPVVRWAYDTSIIQHTIPLKENQKPFKQKLKRINPVLLPLIEKEIKCMYEAGIIAPIRFSEWVSNLLPTRK